MINTFRSEMPQPIAGLGHSFGATMLVNLAFLHPRLLSTVVLLDPVIHYRIVSPAGFPDVARMSTCKSSASFNNKKAR
jgi:pimeloyl-ACP methyl ester carboxylesterase